MRRLVVIASLLVSLIVASASASALSPTVAHADTCSSTSGGVCPL